MTDDPKQELCNADLTGKDFSGVDLRDKNLWLANCYFAHNSSGFPVLLPFFDAQSGRSFHPIRRHPGPVAWTWRRPLHSGGVASPQTPTPDRESLPKTIAQSTRVGPHPRRLAGALGASNPFAPVRNCTETFDTARNPSENWCFSVKGQCG